MKTILFTGCTDGIGLEAVRMLVGKGHKVLMHGRNPTKLERKARELGLSDVKDSTFTADLSDLSQVYRLATQVREKHPQLDVLVNNAGVIKAPNANVRTADGLDLRLAVNTLAPYILTKELLPIISPNGRVINVASAGQAPLDIGKAFPKDNNTNAINTPSPYTDDFEAYCQSKLALIMWTNVLAAEYPQHMIASLNPASLIGTKMVKEAFGAVQGTKSLDIGANILVEAAVGEQFEQASGKYFDNDKGSFGQPHPDANNMPLCQSLVREMDEWLSANLPVCQNNDLN